MKLTLIFASVVAICGFSSAAPSIRKRCSNATVTSRTSFIGNEGHDIQISTISCGNRRQSSIRYSDLIERQDDCLPDTRGDCRDNVECTRDNQRPSPPTFMDDCNTLMSALNAFSPDFSILANQMLEVSFATCTLTFEVSVDTSGICASNWATVAGSITSRCSVTNEGGDTICNSGVFDISIFPNSFGG
ncbi:hypothetical protein DFH09DRAFT_1157175 [Mycena vulgaris]|nr:hypothetical protein DFH09DRAFT_1157175 [Mycena vulgaris]